MNRVWGVADLRFRDDAQRSAVPAPIASRRPRVLLLCAGVMLAYRVLRCAAEVGCEVFALGPPVCAGLARSRFCRGFEPSAAPVNGAGDEALLNEINRRIAAWGVDLVVPGDAPATRSLIALKSQIAAPCFPLPDLATFDALNDKWSFYRLCVESGLRTPQAWLFRDKKDFAAFDASALPDKAIAKPLSESGSKGCVVIEPARRAEALAQIDYAPILVQAFVEGADIDASAFCERGAVTAFVCYSRDRSTYRTHEEPEIRRDIERLLGPLAADGVYNFDIRRDPDGRMHHIECNPRFFHSMDLSAIGGTNFVACGLGRGQASPFRPATVRLPKALLRALPTPWRIERESWRGLRFLLADPIPYLREALFLELS